MVSEALSHTITLKTAEWAALCICANHGATQISQKTFGRNAQTGAQMVGYCDQAVKVIRAALQRQDGAAAQSRAPSADASDDTPGAGPQAG